MANRLGHSNPGKVINSIKELRDAHSVSFVIDNNGAYKKYIMQNESFRVFAYISKEDEYAALKYCVTKMCEKLDDYTALTALN